MRKLITCITLTLVLSSLNSCRKNKNPLFDGVNCTGKCFIITGKILDSAANMGLANAEVKFYFRDITGTFFSKTSYLGNTHTDFDGNYTFTFDGTSFKNTVGYFYAEGYKDNMFYDPVYGNRFSAFYLDTTIYNIPLVQNYSLYRPAILKVRVIANSVTSSQSLSVYYDYGKIRSGIGINGGRPIDTVLTFKTAGDIRTFISAEIRSVGFSNSKYDTVIVNSNTTKSIEIKF